MNPLSRRKNTSSLPPALEVSIKEGVQQLAVNFRNDPNVVTGFFAVTPVAHSTIGLQFGRNGIADNCLTPFTLDAAFSRLLIEVL
jgi:hypothetical protein